MELITNILIEYLKHNKRIVVPKLGAFIVKQPSGIIRFTDLMRNDDGVLRSLLVAYGMSEIEAVGRIDRYVFEVRHAISQNGKFTIANFGVFRASDNNTIIFTHNSEPKIIGGNVKPPIDVLDTEKLKLQLLAQAMAQPAQQKPKKESKKEGRKENKKKSKKRQEENTTLSLSKPDSYLRGLNYDDRKKKRGDDRGDKRRAPRRTSPLLILFILVLVAGGVYGLWYWLDSQRAIPQQTTSVVKERTTIEVDSLAMPDSLLLTQPVDSLQQLPEIIINRDYNTINNIVTE